MIKRSLHGSIQRAAPTALAPLIIALSACGGASLESGLPSGSGTLANAAIASSPPKKSFNPFVENSTSNGRREVITDPTIAQVMQPGPLPERAVGSATAPVTVIKYASMTCPYCRQFQATTFPELKRKYIDTGRVRFILREFPIGFQSGAATIALRCVPEDKYFAAYDALMKHQARWVSQDVRRDPIWQVVRRFGLTRQAFDACFNDEALIANLDAIKQRGRTLGVIGTPNFFVNAKLYKRVLTMTDFDQIVASGAQTATANSR